MKKLIEKIKYYFKLLTKGDVAISNDDKAKISVQHESLKGHSDRR